MRQAAPTTVDVVIVGGGAAGLAAAHDLVVGGLTVCVLEARDRIGGRLFTLHDPHLPVAVELGAEFIQGLPRWTLDIVRAAGLLMCAMSGEFVEVHGGSFRRLAGPLRSTSAAFERLDLWQGSDRSLADFLRASGLPAGKIRAAEAWVKGYDAADPELISARALIRQHRAESAIHSERGMRLPLGYAAIVEWLASRLPAGSIVRGTRVTEVEWQPNGVVVRAQSGAMFHARRAVVTTPLGVLASGAIRFEPRLPEKERAIRGLRMGAVIKVLLRFDEPFWWPSARPGLGFVRTFGEDFGVWWTTYPIVAPLLVGWTGGPSAEALSALTDDQILERALSCLRGTFGRNAESRLAAWYLHNWQTDPLAYGAYSYVVAGGMRSQASLARPVENTLFFAGEATEHSGHHATVHGAIHSGQRAAREVLGSLSLPPD